MRDQHLGRTLAFCIVGICLVGCTSTSSTDAVTVLSPAADTDTPVSHPALRAELQERFQLDQTARHAMIAAMQAQDDDTPPGQFGPAASAAMKEVMAVDEESAVFLRNMIDTYGWPTYDMVGEDGAHAAWLLAQHADQQPALQTTVLAAMRPLVESGQANGRNLAYLEDRVRTGQQRPQLYGTQFGADAHGVSRPLPVEDAANVDARRADVGLPPLAEYAAQMSATYGEPTDPTPMAEYPSSSN